MPNHVGNFKSDGRHNLNDLKAEELALYYKEMVQAHLLELEIETPDGKIVLKRKQHEKDGAQPQRRKSDFSILDSDPVRKEPAAGENVPMIHSPIMGTFYRSSSPQSAPFVKEGATVNAGSTLCIVEAMKVMNEIKAEYQCKIIKIRVENGKSVAKGDPLFQVELL